MKPCPSPRDAASLRRGVLHFICSVSRYFTRFWTRRQPPSKPPSTRSSTNANKPYRAGLRRLGDFSRLCGLRPERPSSFGRNSAELRSQTAGAPVAQPVPGRREPFQARLAPTRAGADAGAATGGRRHVAARHHRHLRRWIPRLPRPREPGLGRRGFGRGRHAAWDRDGKLSASTRTTGDPRRGFAVFLVVMAAFILIEHLGPLSAVSRGR